MRTVIYARYSTDHQNSRSIDDQIAVCVERAKREGWTVVDVFTDAAISGAAGISDWQRPGMAAMLAKLEAGGVDQILTESTSRMARDEGDSYELRRTLKFLGVRLFTLSDGEIDDFRGSIRAIIDAQQRRDTAANVKRGQRGTVSDGRLPGGRAYGYRIANRIDDRGQAKRGLRAIDEHEADIIVRIFTEYAAGISTRSIAERLNQDGIPSPRGGKWTSNAILGDRKRGVGILKNAIYVGRIVHFRTHKIAHPQTRRTLIRPNRHDEHVAGEAPHLRIIDDALWDRVQAELEKRSHGPREHQRRPKRLLSGLMECAACGGKLIVIGGDYWSCGAAKSGKGCTNKRKILNGFAEEQVLTGLKGELVDPELVEAYVAKYAQQRARRVSEVDRERARIKAAHDQAVLRVERLVEAVANGMDEFDEIRDMIRKARTERDALAEQLGTLERFAPVAVHPTIARDYRRQIASLADALADPHARIDAVPQVRALIGAIIAHPRADGRGLRLEVRGRLDTILQLASGEGTCITQAPPAKTGEASAEKATRRGRAAR